MQNSNIEYVIDNLQAVRKLAQLGALSQNHMEAQIFRKIFEGLVAPLDCLGAELENRSKGSGDTI